MSVATMIAWIPLTALVLGGAVGLLLGLKLSARIALVALGAVVLACIVLLVRLAVIQPGNEEAAFTPFIWLTGGLFPALFGGIVGWIVGRALAKRRQE